MTLPVVALQPVQEAELDGLLTMLHALAESDGVPHVATTRQHLFDAIFATNPVVYAAWVMVDEARAGFVIYSWKWGPFTGVHDLYMQAIYIQAAFRARGVGQAAMRELAKMAVARGSARMEWHSVRDKVSSRRFYERIGALAADHMLIQRLPTQAMRQLAAAGE